MSEIVRFSVSLESDLLEEFEKSFLQKEGFSTRSDAIRQLLREKLKEEAWANDSGDVAASLTLVFDHHRSRLSEKMIDIQHEHGHCVVSTMHVHLTHDLCMELIALRGPAKDLQRLASKLGGLKGIHQAQLVIAHAQPKAEDSPPDSHHHHDHGHEDRPGHRHL